MTTFINQYSAILAYGAVVIGAFAFLRWRLPAPKRRVGLLVATAVALFVALFLFQPTRSQASATSWQAAIEQANGRALLVELYSDYCLACWRARPTIEAIAADNADQLHVLHLNVQDAALRPLIDQLQFRFTPTYILFDPNGQELWRRSGALQPDELHAQLAR